MTIRHSLFSSCCCIASAWSLWRKTNVYWLWPNLNLHLQCQNQKLLLHFFLQERARPSTAIGRAIGRCRRRCEHQLTVDQFCLCRPWQWGTSSVVRVNRATFEIWWFFSSVVLKVSKFSPVLFFFLSASMINFLLDKDQRQFAFANRILQCHLASKDWPLLGLAFTQQPLLPLVVISIIEQCLYIFSSKKNWKPFLFV